MPHQETIQAAFGDHDISGIRAHVDPSSSRAMGAEAYATGDHVVFGHQPDLHTAAHEAAHVVQQKQGVQLSGGVGAEGDAHERQADAVADRVVAGTSAGDLLGPAGGGAAQGQAVQKKPAVKAADPGAAHDTSDRKSYDSVNSALLDLAKGFHVWGPEAQTLMHGDASGDAGTAPAEQAIMSIYQHALTEARLVGELISTADKGERSTLSPLVRQVLGAYTRFWAQMQQPASWMGARQQPIDLHAIQTEIDGYANRLGYGEQKLDPDTTAPEGDEKALSKTMISDQFVALDAALASVKAGNDADASRIMMHLRYIDNMTKERPAEIKTHKAHLKTVLKEVDAILQQKPGLSNTLAEAHNHLVALVK
ncbi:MAG: DUF4157 domain-containing protein [Kofleriaceae bacterium]